MEYEGYVAELWAEGYREQPSLEIAEGDTRVIKRWTCCWCSRPLQYEGFVNPSPEWGSGYIALAVCRKCNYCEEF